MFLAFFYLKKYIFYDTMCDRITTGVLPRYGECKMEKKYIPFTQKMIKSHKILIPTMLPLHFSLVGSVLSTYGYNVEILSNNGREVVETGLKYAGEDAYYSAVLVIGQFLSALKSGRYDSTRTALLFFCTGGMGEAHYLNLLHSALESAGFENIPVISLSSAGIEKHPGFDLDSKKLHGIIYAVLYGDLMMSLSNQCKPYEKNDGACDELIAKWQRRLGRELGAEGVIEYGRVKENCRQIVRDFASIELEKRSCPKVGIVGELYVKYSPLGNNCLEDFLMCEGAEVVVPGLADSILYTIHNSIRESRGHLFRYLVYKFLYGFIFRKKNDIIRIVKENSDFAPMTPFEDTLALAEKHVGDGNRSDESRLLVAEMLALSESGVKNIVCNQPLNDDSDERALIDLVKSIYSDVNVVSVDYDVISMSDETDDLLRQMIKDAK